MKRMFNIRPSLHKKYKNKLLINFLSKKNTQKYNKHQQQIVINKIKPFNKNGHNKNSFFLKNQVAVLKKVSVLSGTQNHFFHFFDLKNYW